MPYAAGVDVGSTQTKAIIINEDQEIIGRALIDTGANVTLAASNAFGEAIISAGLGNEEVEYVIGTGYGRYKVTFGNKQITEISCHGKGAVHMFPKTRTVIDMGGQDSKAIQVNENGEIIDFCMNDKCAAGTGRFLGAASQALDIPLGELGTKSLQGTKPVRISTTCTVFAESEILSWLGKGKNVEDILKGVHQSIAARAIGLLKRVGIRDQLSFSGGVAKNIGMVKALEDGLGLKINTSDESHFMGAIGAALFALECILESRKPRLRKEVAKN